MLKVVVPDVTIELEAIVDADIQAFDEWFQKIQRERGNESAEPLVRSERAILKTYLYWKTKGESDAQSHG